MSYSPELGGVTTGGFAPANFDDTDDMAAISALIDIGGNGSNTPYTNALNAMITKHKEELRTKAATALQIGIAWNKHMREFISVKNTELLNFLKMPVDLHPVMGPGDVLLRRFGNPQVHPNHPSVKEFVLDGSGADVAVTEISAALDAVRGDGGIKGLVAQTKFLYEKYQEAAQEALKQQGALKMKLEKLDKIQKKLSVLFDVDVNEQFGPLMEATEGYLKKVFQDNQIEEEYKKLVEAYRRFAAMRDIVVMMRTSETRESEPMCSICLHEPVTYAFAPCGHTYCASCMRQQSNVCFMCRGAIKDRVKLYFG